MQSERFQLDFPDDFPTLELEAVHAHLTDTGDGQPQSKEWGEWAAACNGIAYRFLALNEHALALATSLDADIAPPMPERYRQERLLFSLFSEGLSCLECFYYGFYFVGAMCDPVTFDPEVDRRLIVPGRVAELYLAKFGGDQFPAAMFEVARSNVTRDWREIRNVLAHRSSPGRGFSAGGPLSGVAEWLGGTLDADGIRERRSWIGRTVADLFAPAPQFVQQQLL